MSGVRSSWETLAKNSSLSRSACWRWVAAFPGTVRASSPYFVLRIDVERQRIVSSGDARGSAAQLVDFIAQVARDHVSGEQHQREEHGRAGRSRARAPGL